MSLQKIAFVSLFIIYEVVSVFIEVSRKYFNAWDLYKFCLQYAFISDSFHSSVGSPFSLHLYQCVKIANNLTIKKWPTHHIQIFNAYLDGTYNHYIALLRKDERMWQTIRKLENFISLLKSNEYAILQYITTRLRCK